MATTWDVVVRQTTTWNISRKYLPDLVGVTGLIVRQLKSYEEKDR